MGHAEAEWAGRKAVENNWLPVIPGALRHPNLAAPGSPTRYPAPPSARSRKIGVGGGAGYLVGLPGAARFGCRRAPGNHRQPIVFHCFAACPFCLSMTHGPTMFIWDGCKISWSLYYILLLYITIILNHYT
jgi:hypothetical protein